MPHLEHTTSHIAAGQIVRCRDNGHVGRVVASREEAIDLAQSGGWGIIAKEVCRQSSVTEYVVPNGTRAYEVVDQQYLARGIVAESELGSQGETVYLLETPTGKKSVPESNLLVRSSSEANAGKLLASGFWSNPDTFRLRLAFLEQFVEQAAAGGGIESFQASEYTPYPHQVAAVERILRDPCPRFLLADEVGLGKTLEAGIVVRELLHRQKGKALIQAPAILLDHWRNELINRLGIESSQLDFGVVGEGLLADEYSVVVMDEVHTITHDVHAMEAARKVCGQSPAVLLISATAAFDDVEVFLPLMNLLNATLYPIGDPARFEARMRRQTEVSELLATFVQGISRRSIRNHLTRTAFLLADDIDVQQKMQVLEAIISDDNYSEDEAHDAMESLRHSIIQSGRISRHVVRASRRLVAEAFRYGRQPNKPISRIAVPLQTEIIEALDEWRLSASSVTALADLSCASSLPEVLRTAIAARLDNGGITQREISALESLMEVTHHAEGLGVVAAEIGRALRAGETAIVFGSDSTGLTALGRRLRDEGLFVAALLKTEGRAEQRRAVLEFERNEAIGSGTKRFVFLCDETGQEGLNLQSADVLVLLDLPWNVVALEQRIGRVDRLGRSGHLRIMAVEHGQEGSLHDAWLQVLESGLGVFEQSVSDVQSVLGELTDQFATAALGGKIGGLEAYRRTVLEERNRQDVRRMLDGDEGREAEILNRTSLLGRAQSDAAKFVKTLVSFGACHGIESRPSFRGDLRLDMLPNAQIPHPWRERLSATCGDAWTERPCGGLPRLGFVHPMARELQKFALWDDDGQASASWRHLPGLPKSEEALFVKLLFLTNDDSLQTKLVQIDGDGAKAKVLSQARRESEARDTTLYWPERRLLERFVGVDLLETLILKALRVATNTVIRSASGKKVQCVAAELVAVSGKELICVS